MQAVQLDPTIAVVSVRLGPGRRPIGLRCELIDARSTEDPQVTTVG